MMLVNIIFAVSFVPVWPILYFMLRNNTKPKKNIILSVTLPESAHGDPEVLAICRGFKRWLNRVMLPLLPLLAPPFFMSVTGVALTWFMIWLLAALAAPHAVFAVHRGRLMALKRERGWRNESAGVALADVRAAALPPKRVNGIWFLLPVITSFIPVADSLRDPSEWMWALYAMFALTTVLFWWMYGLIFRLRAETVNESLTLTMALTRARRYQWNKFWLAAAWLTGLFNLAIWLFEDSVTAFLVSTLVYTLLIFAVAIKTEFSARIAQQKLTAGTMGEDYQDEDDCWLLGMLYHNPNDSHFLVNHRIGMNMSVNLAKPAGKILMGFAALCIAAMPFLGIWTWAEEVTPASLTLNETELVVRHTRSFSIPAEAIESVELLEELPYMFRIAGSGFSNLSKGRWSVRGYGNAQLNIHPKNPPFLFITAGGELYIVNDADGAVTRGVYSRLKER
ncbi:MAG: hypothetical protein FWG72_09090 [Oscillospiraceae bacterium]|nr:hypothetical protein [Oscillospiraceae bacterium]